MNNTIQDAVDALLGLEFQFSKLSDKDWTSTFEIIRAALKSSPVDVELDDFIDYEDDAKCKWQSVTAHLCIPGALHSPEALEAIAFGATEKQAKENLLEIIQPIRDALNTPPQSYDPSASLYGEGEEEAKGKDGESPQGVAKPVTKEEAKEALEEEK